MLEDEAYRRAVEGVEKPIKVGDEIKTIREYSDTLLIFLLKGAAPEKYRERYEHALGASAGQTLQIEIVRVQARPAVEAEEPAERPNGRIIEVTCAEDKPN